MVVYHFCFDLHYFGQATHRFEGSLLGADFNHDPFWLGWRTVILSLFLFVGGLSLASRHKSANACWNSRSYGKRQLQLLAAAVSISLVSYFVFPETWIRFGVLHFFFVAGLIAPFFLGRNVPAGIAGAILIAIPLFYRHFAFQSMSLVWTGLAPLKPATEDFVPILPWLGVMLFGIALQPIVKQIAWKPSNSKAMKVIGWVGGKSLPIYLLHQICLFPLVWVVNAFCQS